MSSLCVFTRKRAFNDGHAFPSCADLSSSWLLSKQNLQLYFQFNTIIFRGSGYCTKIEEVKLMNNYTVEMTFLASRPAVLLSPPVPSALYELNAPIPVGRGLEDKHSVGSDDTIKHHVKYIRKIKTSGKYLMKCDLKNKNHKPPLH